MFVFVVVVGGGSVEWLILWFVRVMGGTGRIIVRGDTGSFGLFGCGNRNVFVITVTQP